MASGFPANRETIQDSAFLEFLVCSISGNVHENIRSIECKELR